MPSCKVFSIMSLGSSTESTRGLRSTFTKGLWCGKYPERRGEVLQTWRLIIIGLNLFGVLSSGSVLAQDSLNVTLVGRVCGSWFTANAVAVSGDYAYVTDFATGLQVVDVADPTSPVVISSYDMSNALGLAVRYDYVYVTGIGLSVVDVSDPENPTETGHFPSPDEAWDVAVSGDYAYVANYEAGLTVVDVSDPSSPTEVGKLDMPDLALGVATSDDYAYVADGVAGLGVVDVYQPGDPTIVDYCDTPGSAQRVTISEGHAFVADYHGGLRVVDVCDPHDPVEIGHHDTPSFARGVAVSGDYAYVAASNAGLRVVCISDPSNPVEVGYYDTPGCAHGAAVSGEYAYVADGNLFEILDCSAATPVFDQPGSELPARFALMVPEPNPFHSTTLIDFEIKDRGLVRVIVSDVAGRVVMADVVGMLEPGRHTYAINGSGLANGTYFCCLESGPNSAVTKMLLLR
jgi:hypothetical protein